MITPAIDGGAALVAKLDALPGEIQRAIHAAAPTPTLPRKRGREASGASGRGLGPRSRSRAARFRPQGHRTAGVPPAIGAAIATALQQVLHP
jgi:hypothetical protein